MIKIYVLLQFQFNGYSLVAEAMSIKHSVSVGLQFTAEKKDDKFVVYLIEYK